MPVQTHTVTIAQALSSGSNGLIVLDSAVNIANVLPNLSLIARVTSFTVTATTVAPTTLTAPQFLALAGLGSILHAPAASLKLNSAATVNVAQLIALESMPGFSLGSAANLTLSDTTANIVSLLASHPAYFGQIAAVTVHLDGTSIGAYPAAQLNGLALHGKSVTFVSTPGHTTLNVAAAAHDLGSNAASLDQLSHLQPLGITMTNEGATINASDAAGLSTLVGFHPGAHTLTVADNAANVMAHANQIFGQGFTQIQVSAGTLSGTAAQLLDPSLHFSAGAHATLSVTTTVSGSTAAALVALPSFALASGCTLTVADTAANLAALPPSVVALASASVITAPATVSAATAMTLAGLAHLSLGNGATLTVQDSVANLLASGGVPSLTSTVELIPGSVVTITAAQAHALEAIAHFSSAGASIIVSDTIANLTSAANSGWQSVASNTQVVDTAADLAAAATTPLLQTAASVTLSANGQVNAAAAAQIASIPHFVAGSFGVTVVDTAAAIAGQASAVETVANMAILTGDAVVSAAVATTLGQMAEVMSTRFSLGGHALAVTDTLPNLLGLSAPALMLATSLVLSANATANVAQIEAFAAMPSVSLGGYAINVVDTASHLLNLSSQALALTGSVSLSADATVNVAQAETLFADPGFSTGGHQLVVADTAAALLSLPSGLQLAVTELALSGSQSVNASTLTQLSTLGIKFNESGHTLTCVDTAANLAALQPSAAALASANVITAPATVSAATAMTLAGLAHLSLGDGATLTVQDRVGNLLALGGGVPSLTSAVELIPGSVVTVNAAQAHALEAIAHFSPAGASITVSDTIANLTSAANSGWQSVASNTQVVDTAADLAAAAATPLLQTVASEVSLSANATVSAASAAQIAGIAHFSQGAFQLTVSDTAADIAARASAIIDLAATAVVTDPGPVSASTADQLATISNAGLLTFQGGDQLQVQDSYAALTDLANASGLALAARLSVLDTASNLVAAAGHDWGAVNPSYKLSQSDVISATQANVLAGLGMHYSANGFVLSVADNAANVVAASNALSELHITAAVADSTANLSAQAAGLLSLGGALTLVQDTDTNSVTASGAAGLEGLAAKLSGPALQVVDTAMQVDGHLLALSTLGAHVAIRVLDSAANVAPVAADLATLRGALSIELTGDIPITASLAADLAPVVGNLVVGSLINVNDTGAAIAGEKVGLSLLGSTLGTISLSDGTTQTAATAADLASLDSHLAAGLMLTATGTGAEITAAETGLSALQSDHRLAAVVVANTSVADATANSAALNELAAQVTILDSASAVDSRLTSLSGLSGLTSIALTDMGTPALSMSISTLVADAAVLSKITSPFTITIDDSASAISADLASGEDSAILAHAVEIGQIVASDMGPIVMTQSQILSTGVDDSANSALAKFAGEVQVSGVDVTHLSQVAGLYHAPAAIAISDTSAAISNDLAQGSASVLLGNLGEITQIVSLDHAVISLTANEALTAGVDDGPSSAIAKLSGAALTVTDATISQLTTLAGLNVPASSISISDTAANISADLASGNSQLVADLPAISAISVQDGQAITLTEQQVLAAGVDNGDGSVLSKVTGGSLSVTNVATADLAAVLGLPVAPTSISITDTSAHLISNLSSVLSDIATISAIDLTGSVLSLTSGEALEAHVDDGSNSLVDKLAGHSFSVFGARVAQLSALTNLPYLPTGIAVADSSSNIAADLTSGQSMLAADASMISSICVAHGTLTLTNTQADLIATTPALDSVFSKLAPTTIISVTGATVADLSTLGGTGWPHLTIAVADTPSAIAADVGLGTGVSTLLTYANTVGSVTLDASGTVDAASLTALAALPHFSDNGYSLEVQDSAAAIAGLASISLGFATAVSVVDTSNNVANNLGELQAACGGALTITLTDSSPSITVTAAQYVQDRATIDAITNHGVVTVTGSATAIAALGAELGADPVVGAMSVTSSAADVIANLSTLEAAGSKLSVTLSDSTLAANLVAPLLTIANLTTANIPVVDTGSQIAQVAESGNAAAVAYLNTNTATLSATSIVSAADAAALEGLSGFQKGAYSLQVWDTASHLTSPTYQAAISNGNYISAVFLKAPGDAAILTAAAAVSLFQIPNFSATNPDGSSNTLTVSDTAAHIEANFVALDAHIQQLNGISGITVNASATVTDQVLTDLQTLGAVANAGVSLVVRDTAVAIANGVVTQSTGSITPSAWQLSANGTLTEAQAALLGSLANFTTAGHTITLSINSDTAISVTDADALGNIAPSLNLNRHHLVVGGSVAQLSTLSPAALGLITPALSDSLTNIITLSASSPLLSGSVEVTDGDSLNAAEVETFLSLVQTGGSGPGVPASSVTMDSGHWTNDSVANLRALVSSTEWTSNPGLHSGFALVARDTVANLIDPANTSFLAGLAVTGLAGNAIVSASAASSLASLASTIHYQADHSITVQDTAANLLDPANAGAMSVANLVELSGPSVVDAADAESLLALNHFVLNTSLTISDSSANLLDNALSTAIANSPYESLIHVQLAGPETLDADTAENLVSLPNFADTTNITIADSSSYLLNSANYTAEEMASSVTLAGNETVSANTVYRLSELPHFTVGTSHLILAGNDFANAATLKAIADDGSAFDANGHSITVTQNVLDLTPIEFGALQSDNVVSGGHVGLLPGAASVTDAAGTLTVSATGYAGGSVQIYSANGSPVLSSPVITTTAGFVVNAADTTPGQNFAITETVSGTEGAPLIVLDASAIEDAVAQAGSSFASSGSIQIDNGKFVNLYEAGSVPFGLDNPALVYDPLAHTVSLDIPSTSSVTLITLGGSTHPASLDTSEILIKHHI